MMRSIFHVSIRPGVCSYVSIALGSRVEYSAMRLTSHSNCLTSSLSVTPAVAQRSSNANVNTFLISYINIVRMESHVPEQQSSKDDLKESQPSHGNNE